MVILSAAISIISFIIALTVHEFSHALVADKLGDPTAKLLNRLTLNPIRHIDPIGTVLLPGLLILSGSPLIFGWAKPVPFDPFNLENPRRDGALIALAGPASNLILATILSLFLRFFSFPELMALFIIQVISINVVLAVFNLIPVEPLDGFKIVAGALPESLAHAWNGLARYGFIILITLMLPLTPQGSILSQILYPTVSFILKLLLGI